VPGSDGTTWQELMTAMATDLLIYDAGVLELVSSAQGDDLAEITTWLGSECFPVTDPHGRIVRYDQDPENDQVDAVSFEPEKICYFQLFKNNRSSLGLPIVESVINECVAVILADEHAMLALDADEIPPGLLVLGGVAGPAAERARADLQSMRGKDHRIRVITSPQPQGIEAKWVELRRSMKDLEMSEVVENMRRIIWRVFGVTPVELGDTEGVPRAAAEVQMDVASSHLISPILELIQARVNAQIIPRLVSDSSRIKFCFDRDLPANATQKLEIAKRAEVLLRNGVITINEARSDIGLLPVEGGDSPFLITAMGPMPLSAVAAGLGYDEPTDDAQEEIEDTDYPDSPDLYYSKKSECCPSSPEQRSRWPKGRNWKKSLREREGNDWLPSDWQSGSRFDNARCVSLTSLATVVIEYAMAATDLYIETAEEVTAIIRSGYKNGALTVESSENLKKRVNSAFDTLMTKWQLRCSKFYFDAARMGSDSAEKWTGNLSEYDSARAAENYIIDAMAWLGDSGGLVGTMRSRVSTIIERATMTRSVRIDKIDSDSEMYEVIETVDGEFAAQAHRIDNWSGKMVPVATVAATRALENTSALITDPATGEERVVIWMYEWAASAGRTCPTCTYEGGSGYRRLDQASVMPGQGTICGARCRCVLVFWTEEEVKDGRAISLTELPPNPEGAIPPPLPNY
jgi:hypothetical protein